jgi:hypothetical protein
MSPWWSVGLTALAFTSQFLVVERRRVGFLLGMAQQAAWMTYAVATRQYAFIASAVLFGWLAAVGWRRWGADERLVATLHTSSADRIPSPPSPSASRARPGNHQARSHVEGLTMTRILLVVELTSTDFTPRELGLPEGATANDVVEAMMDSHTPAQMLADWNLDCLLSVNVEVVDDDGRKTRAEWI